MQGYAVGIDETLKNLESVLGEESTSAWLRAPNGAFGERPPETVPPEELLPLVHALMDGAYSRTSSAYCEPQKAFGGHAGGAGAIAYASGWSVQEAPAKLRGLLPPDLFKEARVGKKVRASGLSSRPSAELLAGARASLPPPAVNGRGLLCSSQCRADT